MITRLTRTDTALVTHTGVVRPWECDRNGHWNVQFYVRAAQTASEVLASAVTGTNPGGASASFRHFRFHAELFSTEIATVLSSRIAAGPLAGRVLHRLVTGPQARLSATAVEIPAYPVDDLPACAEADLARAVPRGLSGTPAPAPAPEAAPGAALPVGVVGPGDVDHLGALRWQVLTGFCSAASHNALSDLGLTASWIDETGTNRMAVEMTVTRHAPARAGTGVEVTSRVVEAGARHFVLRHGVFDAADGRALARVEQLLLMVDLTARKPVAVPDFIRAAARP